MPRLCLIGMLVPAAAFGGLARPAAGAAPLLNRKSAVPVSRLPAVALSAEQPWEATWDPVTGAASITRNGIIEADDDDTCDISKPTSCGAPGSMPEWASQLNELQERGLGSVALLLATAISLSLSNIGATSRGWLALWSTPLPFSVAGHALSLRGWVNEGLMAIFFFVVGLEIKQEMRLGSLSSVKKALLPCIAAVGGMVTPILVYLGVQRLPILAGGSLSALAVPMATDIAFAMAIFSFFRSRMPPSSSAFLLTLATVDDLGAILVLATCFAHNVAFSFLAAAAVITGFLALQNRKMQSDVRVYSAGGVALWWCLLRSGVSADVAGVLAALCLSTRAMYDGERLSERLIMRLSPLSTFFIMPVFALANTAVPLGGVFASASRAASVGPAAGVGIGLLLGKPLGIFGATWAACRLGVAQMPANMRNIHLGVVSVLGAIGFTMCLLLTEVSMPAALQPLPKLVVLVSSAIASVVGALLMARLRPFKDEEEAEAPTPASA